MAIPMQNTANEQKRNMKQTQTFPQTFLGVGYATFVWLMCFLPLLESGRGSPCNRVRRRCRTSRGRMG